MMKKAILLLLLSTPTSKSFVENINTSIVVCAARGDESLSPVEFSSLVNENLTSHQNEHRPAIRMRTGLNKIRVRSSQQAEGRILW